MSVMPESTAAAEERPRRFYVTVTTKFFVAIGAAAVWAVISAALSYPLVVRAGPAVPQWLAWTVVVLVAVIPGWLLTFLGLSLAQDDPPRLALTRDYPDVTVVVPVTGNDRGIGDTLLSIRHQSYPGRVAVAVVDGGSTDDTRDMVRRAAEGDADAEITLLELAPGERADALNAGIRSAATELVATVESGSFLQPQALERIVARMLGDPPHTAAVAGTVLVRNSRESLMSRMQEWDYFLGIASLKRQQALYQGTLVAQRGFSLFRRDTVLELGGWPRVEGEDLVLTWALLKAGHRIGYEPTAIDFARVPASVAGFVRERRGAARAVAEGVRVHRGLVGSRARFAGFLAAIDALIPLLDLVFAVALVPAIALAVTGHPWLLGPMLLCMLPPTLLVGVVIRREQHHVFTELSLHVRRNVAGWVGYLLAYRLVMAPVSVWGYAQAFGAGSDAEAEGAL